MELTNKAITFLGDSITEGHGVTDIENCRFDNVLKRECGLRAVYNHGIGGTRLAHQITPSEKPRHDLCFCGRVYDLEKDADIIVVYGGVNDFMHGDAPFGAFGDKTPATFCGGVYFLMHFIKENYPDKTVVFMTPAHCCTGNLTDRAPSPRPEKQNDAKPLIEYIKIIERTAKEFAIPTLNLFEKLGIDPNFEEDSKKYTTDGLHFNDLGHPVIAAKLKEFLLSL